MQIRRLTEADEDVMRRQFTEAFGAFDPPEPPVPLIVDGKRWWGAEVGGRIVATALDREYASWFGGVRVPTAGIGGVTVAPEHRGAGLLRPLFTAMLAEARERGALVSTLYATAPALYRRFGFETVSSLDDVRLPTHALAVGGSTPVRRATSADDDAIRAVHDRAAARENGPLARTGPLFTESPTLRVSGVSVAEREGEVVGYVSWDRGRGYGAEGELVVGQLMADDADALRSLLSLLSTFASVTPTVRIRTSGVPPWQHLLRTAHPETVSSAPYALAVLDPAALALPRVHPGIDTRLPFSVDGRSLTLAVADGSGHVEPTGTTTGCRTFTRGGLALTFAGAATSATLRSLGHVEGDTADDVTWDLLFTRGPVTVHDYF
ncbi:putative acetyltransferase [Aeromicrobium sp. SORGH_AS981]|uniref:GNAT family N-acetyltransferase n=1 Tax=Aeromicrobium sp. SORGH_AS_0981 TaxID=3041802 RepID=UPI0028679801|nr:GNAT family N-acetyltransferase [Aeromicrobium sp. SORGH_AS_0981]MDR6119934.1 putative acetyltransferase [Aeromicrobium sp. SORGH_AS_0981]